MKNMLTKLFLVSGMALVVGCGGSMEADEQTDATVPAGEMSAGETSDVSQQALPVCGSGLDCRGYSVSGSYTCVQTPTSTRAVYCCPSGQRVYHNDAGAEWCA
ncbi:hypothetical protein CYFUS_006703 [Cystobacter fuscus]|uniref:Lipoprotein n=1 Tax=Cystobacter fuscus TaxID=43 RepID=A0A250JCE8_9BACT|nr:hypothetical protein [Cystobacter fuscus]ATB41238.1 hypothetical protein CYFUS_006703 [Cystobacter fuscus]